jgi:hypothetical protein
MTKTANIRRFVRVDPDKTGFSSAYWVNSALLLNLGLMPFS